MRKKLLSILGAWALFAGLASTVRAQQLYFRDIDVGDGGFNYCDSNMPKGTLGTSRSFDKTGGNVWANSALIEFERPRNGYPGACLSLCATIVCVSTETFGIDELSFEIFKFGKGANPLNADSTPPVKTIMLYNIGHCTAGGDNETVVGTFCANWDGAYNLNGIFGKTNGQFGFRAKVVTNKTSPQAGNIKIDQTSAYPGQNQIPIQVDVTNIHSVRSSPTVVGRITGVAAQPYNILYRLSKDAIASISVYDATSYLPDGSSYPLVRNIILNTPRVGEGTPDGGMTNGDFWDGRDNHGDLVPAGNYLVRIDAYSNDLWDRGDGTSDRAWTYDAQLSLDPLQITDFATKPLGASSTDMAVISYTLTEAATVYVEIYAPGTVFTSVNTSPPTAPAGSLLRRFTEQKESRETTATYWDGRDSGGNPVCDGNYVYAVYASMPGAGGLIRTRRTYVGTIPVARGPVLAFMSPSSAVIGSSSSVAGLDPFRFRYVPSRDTYITLKIKEMDGHTVVRDLVTNEMRASNFSNSEIWDGKDNDGHYVPSRAYLAELTTTDPFQCAPQKTATVTSVIPVNMFRVVDVITTPLLDGTSGMAKIYFTLSQAMYITLNIYPVGTTIDPTIWPPVVAGVPLYTFEGIRPGRYGTIESWKGRDEDGRMLDDGRYPYTLVACTVGATPEMCATDKTYGYVDIARGKISFSLFDVIPSIPAMYNSSDTVTLPPYEIDYVVNRPAKVTVEVLNRSDGSRLANVLKPDEFIMRDADTMYNNFWDGKDEGGNFVPRGDYDVRVTAQDIDSDLASVATMQMTINVDPLRIYDMSIMPFTLDNMAVVSYQISEPMKVVTKIYKPGTQVPPNSWQDPQSGLIKRIIGVRPSRTQISEYWDGTDLTLSKVPDGNYVFKVYASTVSEAINTITGDVAGSVAVLATDIMTENIPVARGGTDDLCGDFTNETFFAPNPYTGTSGWFKIPVIVNGWISLKIYNIAGDLVYKRNFGDINNPRSEGSDINGGGGTCVNSPQDEACWPKVNSYGRTVAPGVYFAVIRFQATAGSRAVCQTIKKILIP